MTRTGAQTHLCWLADKQLSAKRWASPIIRPGQHLQARPLQGLSPEQLGELSRLGGQIISQNACSLNTWRRCATQCPAQFGACGHRCRATLKHWHLGSTLCSCPIGNPSRIRSDLWSQCRFFKHRSPFSAPNVRLAGQTHRETGILYDYRRLPIFDDVAMYDTRLNSGQFRSASYQGQMRMASRDLWQSIQRGEIPVNLFTPEQLFAIERGSSKIPSYTWHHHKENGRMQLAPERIHDLKRHICGLSIGGKNRE